MLSSLSWRSWSVATGNRQADRLGGRRDEADDRDRHRSEEPPRAHPAQDLLDDLAVGPVARPAEEHSRPIVESSANAWTAARARSATANGWNRASPLPVIGVTPGDSRTRPARMLKNPSRGPYMHRRREDRPVEPARPHEGDRLRLRARVVQGRVVDDAHRAEVDEPPDAGLGRGPQDEPRALGVDQAEARAAVPVARDRGEVEDRVRAGRARAAGSRAAVMSPIVRARGARAGPASGGAGRFAASSVADERADAVAGVDERGDEVAADEPAGAGDEDRWMA